jgi:hypothetical protein
VRYAARTSRSVDESAKVPGSSIVRGVADRGAAVVNPRPSARRIGALGGLAPAVVHHRRSPHMTTLALAEDGLAIPTSHRPAATSRRCAVNVVMTRGNSQRRAGQFRTDPTATGPCLMKLGGCQSTARTRGRFVGILASWSVLSLGSGGNGTLGAVSSRPVHEPLQVLNIADPTTTSQAANSRRLTRSGDARARLRLMTVSQCPHGVVQALGDRLQQRPGRWSSVIRSLQS